MQKAAKGAGWDIPSNLGRELSVKKDAKYSVVRGIHAWRHTRAYASAHTHIQREKKAPVWNYINGSNHLAT